jgi:hypothetical protein
MLECVEYERLAVVGKKYITQEKKESRLQKALDAAHKLIAELKAQIVALTKELFVNTSQYTISSTRRECNRKTNLFAVRCVAMKRLLNATI